MSARWRMVQPLMARLGRAVGRVACAVVAVAVAFTFAVAGSQPARAQPPSPAFDRVGWAADFETLKAAITTGSPNFEWAATRGLDLAAVERRARTRLAAAGDDAAARDALDRFVRSFADGHMELVWPRPATPPVITAPASAASDPVPICERLGFRDDPDRGAIARDLPGYRRLDLEARAGAGEAGLVAVAGRRVGVLRIPLFAPDRAACAAALAERPATGPPCDDACGETVARRADALLIEAITRRVAALKAARIDLLLVDVADNGGGNDTADAVAALLGGPTLVAPEVALIRDATTARDLAEDAAALRAAAAGARGADATLITGLLARLDRARADALVPCDLAPLWRGERPRCTNLVRGSRYSGGLVAHPLSAGQRLQPWAALVSSTSHLAVTPGLWRGPLIVLVDGNSASATELFAAMLQDAGRATVLGAPTFGAGCGFTRPARPITLPHSRATLTMPDCARFRRDGTNELGGIEPDILIGLRPYDSPAQRAARLARALPGAIEAALKPRQ